MKKNIENNKLWIAISSVGSGIITQMIYDEFFKSQNNNIWYSIILIFSMFFFTWLIITLIIPTSLRLYDRWKLHNPIFNSSNTIIENYHIAKKDYISLKQQIKKERNIFLFIDDIFFIVVRLYKYFYSKNTEQKNVINSVFRTNETTLDIKSRITKYEFVTLLYDIKQTLEDLKTQELYTLVKNKLIEDNNQGEKNEEKNSECKDKELKGSQFHESNLTKDINDLIKKIDQILETTNSKS